MFPSEIRNALVLLYNGHQDMVAGEIVLNAIIKNKLCSASLLASFNKRTETITKFKETLNQSVEFNSKLNKALAEVSEGLEVSANEIYFDEYDLEESCKGLLCKYYITCLAKMVLCCVDYFSKDQAWDLWCVLDLQPEEFVMKDILVSSIGGMIYSSVTANAAYYGDEEIKSFENLYNSDPLLLHVFRQIYKHNIQG